MSDAPDVAVPASIAAIMAAIRAEVTAPGGAAAASEKGPRDGRIEPPTDPAATAPAPREDRGGTAAGPLPPNLDDEVRTLLAPLLKDWLDAHLPEIVEAATRAEIRRLTGLNDVGD